MSASGPPPDDLPPLHSRTAPLFFAWGKSPNVMSEIVARDHELARLRVLLEATRDGATTTLVVEGEPGIGKTTLLAVAPRSDRWQPSRHDRSHQLNGHQHFAMCPGGKLAGTVTN